MTATPVVEETLQEILLRLDPDLNRSPTFMPTPDPPINLGVFGKRLDWSDVFTAAVQKVRDVLPHGTTITQPSLQDVQNAAEAALGQSIAAVGGFVEQTAASVVHLASLVDATVANIQSNMLQDFRNTSLRLDKIDAVQSFVAEYVVPNLQAQITQTAAVAKAEAIQAQLGAEKYALETIFAPVYTELLKVQPAIDASIKANNPVLVASAQSKVNALHDLLNPVLAGLAAGLGKVETEVTECVKPMCDTLGPKTDLGKLLKAFKFAEWAAIIASLASLRADGLEGLLSDVEAWSQTAIREFESAFLTGGKTLGETITGI